MENKFDSPEEYRQELLAMLRRHTRELAFLAKKGSDSTPEQGKGGSTSFTHSPTMRLPLEKQARKQAKK